MQATDIATILTAGALFIGSLAAAYSTIRTARTVKKVEEKTENIEVRTNETHYMVDGRLTKLTENLDEALEELGQLRRANIRLKDEAGMTVTAHERKAEDPDVTDRVDQ
jgi:hypothetical protein